MDKSKDLIKNTIIIFIGRFCTQFISFFLVPLHTTYLLTSDYGYVDLVQNYIFLLLPIIFLRFDSAIFRFLVDIREDEVGKKKVISSSFIFMLLLNILLIIASFIISKFYTFNYFNSALLSIVLISLSSFLLQLARGMGRNVDYAIASIISGIATLFLNYLLIVKLHYNASGILYATAIANFFCLIYLIFKLRVFKYVNIKNFDNRLLKEMLMFSLPLVPDGLSWWFVNLSDRIMVSAFLGVSSNGIYAISGKLSNILSSLYQIFNMSWQESASLHIDSDDSSVFFTKVLNQSYKFFYSICHFLMVSIPFVFYWFVGEKFNEAYIYIPPLLLGNLFNALANIIGVVYIAKKETTMVSKTTISAAIVNIVINLLFLKRFGLYIATVSTLLSYILLTFYRYVDVKKYIKMELEPTFFIKSLFFFVCSSVIYFINTFHSSVLNFILSVAYLIWINKEDLKNIIKKRRVK